MLLNQTVFLVALGINFFWLATISFLFYQIWRHYQRLTQGVTPKDLKSVLEKILKDFEQQTKGTDLIIKEVESLKKENNFNIQKLGLVRYNPFAETGGDQSFCLAILDGDNSGLVISSLHSRDTTRVYAKPVRKNKAAGYELSVEEAKAIKQAKKIK